MKETITYCFSLQLKKYYSKRNFKITMEFFKKAYESAVKFYNVEILTDDFSIEELKQYGYDCKAVTNEKFLYHDDFKVFLLENYKNLNILVDPDIVFYKKVNFSNDDDLIVDRVYRSLTEDHTVPMIKEFIENGIQEIYPDYTFIQTMPNIGFLKFNNINLKLEYIKVYKKLKSWIMNSNIKHNLNHSILLGQYPLQILCNKFNITPTSLQDLQGDKYFHYDGERKYLSYKKSLI